MLTWQACCQLSHLHSPEKIFDASVLLLEINASLPWTLTHWEFAVLTLLLTWAVCFGKVVQHPFSL